MPLNGATSSPRIYRYSRPMRDIVSERIRNAIYSGEFPPGHRLVEQDLADEFHVSRSPVREAIRILHQEGLVIPIPSRGMVVTRPTRTDVMDLFDIREALEQIAVVRTTERATPADLQELADELRGAREAISIGDYATARTHNSRFHDLLIDMAASPSLSRVIEPVLMQQHWLFGQIADFEALADEHDALLAVIASGDAAAAREMSCFHVQHYRELTVDLLFPTASGEHASD